MGRLKHEVEWRAKRPNENYIQWLKSCRGHPDVDRALERLDALIAAYPETGRYELLRRLHKPDAVSFHGAYLELLTYELFSTIPLTSVFVPPRDASRSTPDLRVHSLEHRFDVEATIFQSAYVREDDQYLGYFFRCAAKHIMVRGFECLVESYARGVGDPNPRLMAKSASSALASLDYGNVVQAWNSGAQETLPRIVVDGGNGWSFRALPRPLPGHECVMDTLAPSYTRGVPIQPETASLLRDTITFKCKQHPESQQIVVILGAVGSPDPKVRDMVRALYGHTHTFYGGNDQAATDWIADGLWNKSAYVNRLKAVIVVCANGPWEEAGLRAEIYLPDGCMNNPICCWKYREMFGDRIRDDLLNAARNVTAKSHN